MAAVALVAIPLVLWAAGLPQGVGELAFELTIFLGFAVATAVRRRVGSFAKRLDIDGNAVVFDGRPSSRGLFGPRIERALVREIVIRAPGEWDAPRLTFVDHRGEAFARSDGAGHSRRRLASFFRSNGFTVVRRTWAHSLLARPSDGVAWVRRRARRSPRRVTCVDLVHRIRLHAGTDHVAFGDHREVIRSRYSCEEMSTGRGGRRVDHCVDAGLLVVYDEDDRVEELELHRPASAEIDGRELLGLPFATAQATLTELSHEATTDGEEHLALGTLGLSLFADHGVIARVRLERASHPNAPGVALHGRPG